MQEWRRMLLLTGLLGMGGCALMLGESSGPSLKQCVIDVPQSRAGIRPKEL